MKKFQQLLFFATILLIGLGGCSRDPIIPEEDDDDIPPVEISDEQWQKDFNAYTGIIDEIFDNNENPTKEMFLARVAEIESMESVEKVYVCDSNVTIVKVDGGSLTVIYNERPDIFEDDAMEGFMEMVNQLSAQNETPDTRNTGVRIAIINSNSNDSRRANQNALMYSTYRMLRMAGFDARYYRAEDATASEINRIFRETAYRAVFVSAHGVFKPQLGYSVIASGETMRRENPMPRITGNYIWIPGKDGNTKIRAVPMRRNFVLLDDNTLSGRLFYFASCYTLRTGRASDGTDRTNLFNNFPGTIVGYTGRNAVGEAVGAIMFFRMARFRDTFDTFQRGIAQDQRIDPITGAVWQFRGSSNFSFHQNLPAVHSSVITFPRNGQFIQTGLGNILTTFTIRGEFDLTINSNRNIHLCIFRVERDGRITQLPHSQFGRLNSRGEFAFTYRGRTWASGVYHIRVAQEGDFRDWDNPEGLPLPILTSLDRDRTISVVFSRNFRENFIDQPEEVECDDDVTEEGVVINGVRWATRNLDYPGTFAPYPHSAGRFYQWGTLNGETHHWASVGTVTGWNNSDNRTAWTVADDPCPAGWRVPNVNELDSLYRTGTWTENWNGTGVRGRVFGTAPNQIFLPAAGRRDTTGWHNVVNTGNYWSSTASHGIAGWSLRITSDYSFVGSAARAFGFSVRCVAE